MTYTGRAARTGNSQALAFEKSLFRAHPEFAEGRLEAVCIGPGYLLVRAIPEGEGDVEDDPVIGAWLAFMEREMAAHPERIRPLSARLLAEADELVGHIHVDPDEDLGDDIHLR
jgi:antitoxin PrlF